MKLSSRHFFSVSTTLICMMVAGCALPSLVPVPVALSEELSTFQLLSGQTGEHSGVITLTDVPFTAGSGFFALDEDRLSIAPASGPGKTAVLQHAGSTIQVNIRLAPAADVDTVCVTGELYGQFTADFDTFLELESVTPSQVPLTEATIAIINEGTMSVCLSTFPEFTGQVVIGGFTFLLAE